MAIFAMECSSVESNSTQTKGWKREEKKDNNEHNKGNGCMAIFAMEWFFGGIVRRPNQRMEEGREKG
jgi:hypothetical protein